MILELPYCAATLLQRRMTLLLPKLQQQLQLRQRRVFVRKVDIFSIEATLQLERFLLSACLSLYPSTTFRGKGDFIGCCQKQCGLIFCTYSIHFFVCRSVGYQTLDIFLEKSYLLYLSIDFKLCLRIPVLIRYNLQIYHRNSRNCSF